MLFQLGVVAIRTSLFRPAPSDVHCRCLSLCRVCERNSLLHLPYRMPWGASPRSFELNACACRCMFLIAVMRCHDHFGHRQNYSSPRTNLNSVYTTTSVASFDILLVTSRHIPQNVPTMQWIRQRNLVSSASKQNATSAIGHVTRKGYRLFKPAPPPQ